MFLALDNHDYHLQFGSPCIDRGNNAASDLPLFDFEGQSRIVDGDFDQNAITDIGADELLPEIAARFGTVNLGTGSTSNVLLLNGGPGDHERVYSVKPGDPLRLECRPPR